MKYIGMPMGMWVLFGKSFEHNLITESGLYDLVLAMCQMNYGCNIKLGG